MGEWLQGIFGTNTVLAGGLTLALLGLAAVWLREVPGKVFGWAKHFLVTTLTVDSRDELMFPALVEYMDSRDALRRLNNFTVRAVRAGHRPTRACTTNCSRAAGPLTRVLARRGLPRLRARRPADVDEARGAGRPRRSSRRSRCRRSAATSSRSRRWSTPRWSTASSAS